MEKDATKSNENTRVFIERRQKKDWVVRSITIIAVVGWICALAAFTLLDRAKPQTADLFTRIFNVQVVGSWNTALLNISFIAILISFSTCAIGFLFNMIRHRRKTDRYNKSIIIVGFISLLFIISFIMYFYNII